MFDIENLHLSIYVLPCCKTRERVYNQKVVKLKKRYILSAFLDSAESSVLVGVHIEIIKFEKSLPTAFRVKDEETPESSYQICLGFVTVIFFYGYL